MILILANKWDLTVDLVVLELRRRNILFVRLNTEDLPRWSAVARLPEESIRLRSNDGTSFSVSDIKAVWNRRPGHVFDDLAPERRPSVATQKFVADQWFAWLESLQLRGGVRWVNHPTANGLMENKIRQLRLAAELGFSIPDTLVTNDAAEVRSWLSQLGGQAICKALYSPLIEEPNEDRFIFTNLLESVPGDLAESLCIAPVIFQRALLSKIDYRVTVVGSQVFAVRVEMSERVLDWRTAKSDVSFSLCDLSTAIQDLCRQYVAVANLSFGAIDLVESNGEFYFLEINPNGEWGWLERPHGVPIASALCDLLSGES
jgi:hypothetical protein